MSHILTLCGQPLPKAIVEKVSNGLFAIGVDVGAMDELSPNRAIDIAINTEDPAALLPIINGLIGEAPVDWYLGPAVNRRKQVLVADMDSTIITRECLDELADYAGVKPEIAAITERAMAGELDFEGALKERIGILVAKGVGEAVLQTCFDERIELSEGARIAVTTMAKHGAVTALVSGGFTFFTERVAKAAGFANQRANTLLFDNGNLTGVADPILGADAKLSAVQDYCAEKGVDVSDALCIGDGSNDRIMVEAAGLGIAYNGHKILRDAADAQINHTDLTTLLYFQGYKQADFAA
ncbi:MAG: phosphoserine phosphatase SerB [Alphaproteobacteria bacterium]